MEPAGALALAGLKAYIQRNGVEGQTLVAVTSGANINFHRLRHVSERSELGEGNEGIFAVTIPEQPGSFLKFTICWAIAVSPNSTTATVMTKTRILFVGIKPPVRAT